MRSQKDKSLPFMIGSLIGVLFLAFVKLVIIFFVALGLGSVIVSGFKAGTQSCGQKLGIEQHAVFGYKFTGDLFCPVGK